MKHYTNQQPSKMMANQPFLLLDILNAGEDIHARILGRLFQIEDKHGNHPYLESYVALAVLPTVTSIQEISSKKIVYNHFDEKITIDLTADGGMCLDEILDWLESEMPKMPIGIDGSMASAMHQYTEYLKWCCTNMENEHDILYAKDLEGIANNEWAIHFTPSFVCLYKKSWANADTRKYSIPSVYFIANYKDFEQSSTLTWNINVDHITPDVQKRDQSDRFPDLLYNALVGEGVKFRLANKQKTASATSLLISIDNQEAVGKMDGDARKAYYESLLAATQTQEIAKLIDRAVASVFA